MISTLHTPSQEKVAKSLSFLPSFPLPSGINDVIRSIVSKVRQAVVVQACRQAARCSAVGGQHAAAFWAVVVQACRQAARCSLMGGQHAAQALGAASSHHPHAGGGRLSRACMQHASRQARGTPASQAGRPAGPETGSATCIAPPGLHVRGARGQHPRRALWLCRLQRQRQAHPGGRPCGIKMQNLGPPCTMHTAIAGPSMRAFCLGFCMGPCVGLSWPPQERASCLEHALRQGRMRAGGRARGRGDR